MAKKMKTPEPTPLLTVSGAALRDILTRQEQLRALKKQAESLEKSIKLDAEPLIGLLEAGAVPEPGCGLLVSIKVDSRRNVKWKEEFITIAGEAKAALLQETCVPSVTKSLSITDQTGAAHLTIPSVAPAA